MLKQPIDPQNHDYFYYIHTLIISVIVLALIAICGELLHIPQMAYLIPGFIPMEMATAIIFLIISASFILQTKYNRHPFSSTIGFLLGAIVVAYGGIISGNEILFRATFAEPNALLGLSSLMSAIGFIFAGCSLIFLNKQRFNEMKFFIDIDIFFCALLMIISLSFDANQKMQVIQFSSASIYSSICFLFISIAFILSNKDTGIRAILSSYSNGSLIARNLIAIVIFSTIVFTFLRLFFEYYGWIDSGVGQTIQTIMTIIVVLSVCYSLAKHLMKSDFNLQKVELHLKENEERYHQLVDMAFVGISTVSANGQITEVNQAFCNLLGYQREQLLTVNIQNLLPSYDIISIKSEAFTRSRFYQFDEEYRRPDGQTLWLQIVISNLHTDNSYLIEVEDITLRKEYEDRIHNFAYHDALTQLPNRRLLSDRLEHAISVAYRQNSNLAVLFLDIDNFKPVNDNLGHDVGDELLKSIAIRMSGLLRQEDTIARISGDEFIILLYTISHFEDAGLVAKKILDQISTHFFINGHDISVSGSIGIAIYPDHGTTINQLIKNADYAMYQAKRAGKNQYRLVNF